MKHWTGFLLLILFLISGMRTLAFDATHAVKCQLDLSSTVNALQASQQAIDKQDMDTALHTIGEARNALQLLEAQCADYASNAAGNSRTNPVPFGQRQHVEMGNKFLGSIELIEYIDNAEDYIQKVRSNNHPAPDETRYIVFRLKYICEKPTNESCNFSRFYFSTVGDKGLVYDDSDVYDASSGKTFNVSLGNIGKEQKIFGGTEIEVEVPFLVGATDSNLVLFTENEDSPVFFASK